MCILKWIEHLDIFLLLFEMVRGLLLFGKYRLFDVTILNMLINAINMMFVGNLVKLCNWLYQLFRYIVIPWNGLICFIGGNQIESSQQLAYLLY